MASPVSKSIYHFSFLVSSKIDGLELKLPNYFSSAILNLEKVPHVPFFRSRIFISPLTLKENSIENGYKFDIIVKGIIQILDQLNPHFLRVDFPDYYSHKELSPYFEDLLKTTKKRAHPNLFHIDPILIQEPLKDRIPFHLDNVEVQDRLNREPIAKSLARLLNKEVFCQKELQNAFMVHLQGEWGAGKSTFLNLLGQNLKTDEAKWALIEFNAWQNQHINPPWWSFINQVYRQGKNSLPWAGKIRLSIRENIRRIIWYSGWYKISSFIITVILSWIIIANHKTILTSVSALLVGNQVNTNDLTKLILSLGSIFGLVYSFSKFLSTPILLKSSVQAKSFLMRAVNPMV